MASGKYRITKVKRSWDEEEHPKYAVEQVEKSREPLLVPQKIENHKIDEEYYKIFFSSQNEKLKVTKFVYPRIDAKGRNIESENFGFRTNKLSRVLEH